MRFQHHFAFRTEETEDINYLESLGFSLNKNEDLHAIDIFEDHPKFNELDLFVKKVNGLQMYLETEFSAEEIEGADFFEIYAARLSQYPEPSNTFKGLGARCDSCGIREKRTEPFKIKREQKWSKEDFFSLNWVFDELFTSAEIYNTHFKQLGVGKLPVLKSKSVLDNVVQLNISELCHVVIPSTLLYSECPQCHRIKYQYNDPGLSLKPTGETKGHIFKSCEYFGHDHQAYQKIFINRALFKQLSEHSVKGLIYVPCRK